MMRANSLPHRIKRRGLAVAQQHLSPRHPARRLASRSRKSRQRFQSPHRRGFFGVIAYCNHRCAVPLRACMALLPQNSLIEAAGIGANLTTGVGKPRALLQAASDGIAALVASLPNVSAEDLARGCCNSPTRAALLVWRSHPVSECPQEVRSGSIATEVAEAICPCVSATPRKLTLIQRLGLRRDGPAD
jgi:hypothetical protein